MVAISIAFNSIGSVFESTIRAGVDTDLKERTIDFDTSRWTALNIFLHHLNFRAETQTETPLLGLLPRYSITVTFCNPDPTSFWGSAEGCKPSLLLTHISSIYVFSMLVCYLFLILNTGSGWLAIQLCC